MADFTYEGLRSGLRPYLGTLGASAAIIALAELAAVPLFVWVGRHYRALRPA